MSWAKAGGVAAIVGAVIVLISGGTEGWGWLLFVGFVLLGGCD